jgi:glyoxylase-like metal-dependent hydrolase (beta-lactamase superfamily II)
VHGRVDRLSPRLRRVTAPNPGPFTFLGTNSYIVGTGTVAIIDPGPAIPAHAKALLAAVAGERVSHILVTHTHLDHSPLAASLKAETGALVGGYGPHGAGKAESGVKVEEGGDMDFVPELVLREGTTLQGPDWTLQALHTPGHCSNHLCFALPEEGALITGDHVMGWSTSVVVPPDGDMDDYMRELERLRVRAAAGLDQVLWPAHGGPIKAPEPFLTALIAHRQHRETQILDALAAGPALIGPLVERVYTDVDPRLHPAAARSVHAHLIRMMAEGRVAAEGGTPLFEARYRLN